MAVLDPNEIMFTAFEPKVQNRFIMYIEGVPAYLIKSATEYDWANDAAINLNVTIAMDYCILNF